MFLCFKEPYLQSFQRGTRFAFSAPSLLTNLTLLSLGPWPLLVEFHYSHIHLTRSPASVWILIFLPMYLFENWWIKILGCIWLKFKKRIYWLKWRNDFYIWLASARNLKDCIYIYILFGPLALSFSVLALF